MFMRFEAHWAPVAILVNNGGVTRPQPIDEITEQDRDEILAVNLKSVFLVTQAVLSKMRTAGHGRIINLSSVAAQTVPLDQQPLCRSRNPHTCRHTIPRRYCKCGL